jgi:hypothetical protein
MPLIAVTLLFHTRRLNTTCFTLSFSRVATSEQLIADTRVLEHIIKSYSKGGYAEVEYKNGLYILCLKSKRKVMRDSIQKLITSGTAALIVKKIKIKDTSICMLSISDKDLYNKLNLKLKEMGCSKPLFIALTASTVSTAASCIGNARGKISFLDLSRYLTFREKLEMISRTMRKGYDCLTIFTPSPSDSLVKLCRNMGDLKCILVTDVDESNSLPLC